MTIHLAGTADPLALHAVPTGGAGVVMGRSPDGHPAVLRLFRPGATRGVLVGGWWFGRLLVFRSLAVGAWTAVYTRSPEQWQGLGQWAVGRPDRVVVAPPGRHVLPSGRADAPILAVVDGAPGPAVSGYWQTRLTVIHQLTAETGRDLDEADIVVMQRLTEPEAELAASRLRLAADVPKLLSMMPDDVFAVVESAAVRFIRCSPTSVEQRYLGQPRRHG